MADVMTPRKAWDPTQDKRGLECRHCGCRHFWIVYTRCGWGGRLIRQRECRQWGKRITTAERQIGA
jgi:hypothetical protein